MATSSSISLGKSATQLVSCDASGECNCVVTLYLLCPERARSSICLKARFPTRSELDYHMQHFHHRLPKECPVRFCLSAFGTGGELAHHLASDHLTDQWPCRYCKSEFGTCRGLLHHNFLLHEHGIFKCPRCDLTFNFHHQRYPVMRHVAIDHETMDNLICSSWCNGSGNGAARDYAGPQSVQPSLGGGTRAVQNAVVASERESTDNCLHQQSQQQRQFSSQLQLPPYQIQPFNGATNSPVAWPQQLSSLPKQNPQRCLLNEQQQYQGVSVHQASFDQNQLEQRQIPSFHVASRPPKPSAFYGPQQAVQPMTTSVPLVSSHPSQLNPPYGVAPLQRTQRPGYVARSGTTSEPQLQLSENNVQSSAAHLPHSISTFGPLYGTAAAGAPSSTLPTANTRHTPVDTKNKLNKRALQAQQGSVKKKPRGRSKGQGRASFRSSNGSSSSSSAAPLSHPNQSNEADAPRPHENFMAGLPLLSVSQWNPELSDSWQNGQFISNNPLSNWTLTPVTEPPASASSGALVPPKNGCFNQKPAEGPNACLKSQYAHNTTLHRWPVSTLPPQGSVPYLSSGTAPHQKDLVSRGKVPAQLAAVSPSLPPIHPPLLPPTFKATVPYSVPDNLIENISDSEFELDPTSDHSIVQSSIITSASQSLTLPNGSPKHTILEHLENSVEAAIKRVDNGICCVKKFKVAKATSETQSKDAIVISRSSGDSTSSSTDQNSAFCPIQETISSSLNVDSAQRREPEGEDGDDEWGYRPLVIVEDSMDGE